MRLLREEQSRGLKLENESRSSRDGVERARSATRRPTPHGWPRCGQATTSRQGRPIEETDAEVDERRKQRRATRADRRQNPRCPPARRIEWRVGAGTGAGDGTGEWQGKEQLEKESGHIATDPLQESGLHALAPGQGRELRVKLRGQEADQSDVQGPVILRKGQASLSAKG